MKNVVYSGIASVLLATTVINAAEKDDRYYFCLRDGKKIVQGSVAKISPAWTPDELRSMGLGGLLEKEHTKEDTAAEPAKASAAHPSNSKQTHSKRRGQQWRYARRKQPEHEQPVEK